MASRFLAALGDNILLFAVPLIIFTQTKSVALTGVAFFIEWAPRVLSLPIAGSLSDRLGGKFVYLSADIVRAVAGLSAFYLLMEYSNNYFVILSLTMAVSAFFYAQSYIAMESMIPKLTEKKDIPKVQSWLQAIEQASMLLGPIIGAWLIIYQEAYYLIGLAGGLFLLAFILILTLDLPSPEKDKKTKVPFAEITKQIQRDFIKATMVLRVYPNLFLLTLLAVSVNLIIGSVMATAVIMATGYFGLSSSEFGIQQSIAGAVTLVVLLALPVIIKKVNLFSVGVLAYCVICVGALSIAVSDSYWIYILCYATVMASGVLFNVYIRSERVLWIPKVHLGKTIGLIVFLNQLTLPIVGILVGLCSTQNHIKILFAILGVVTTSVLLLIFSKLKLNSRILTAQGL